MHRRRFLMGAAALVAAVLGTELWGALTRTEVKAITDAARSKLDLKYLYGASNIKTATDCSLLTQHCYKQAGFAIPRSAADQFKACPVSYEGSGCLLFFSINRNGTVDHVGIGLGDGMMINANSTAGKVVRESYTVDYWKKRFVGARTVR